MAFIKFSLGITLVKLATLLAVNPAWANANQIEQRDHTTTTVTVTATAAPTTITVNPNDPTITKPPSWTSTVAPPDFIDVTTTGCVSYSFIIPEADHPTSVATVTVTQRSTVTVTNTARLPLTTYTLWPTPTVTVTTPLRTLVSLHCTNTLIVSYYDGPDAPATFTFSWWPSTSYVTGLCKTTTTRTTIIPGVTLPTTTPLADWEWFTSGTTLATKYSIEILDLTQITVPGVTTATRCNSLNPSPTITTTVTIKRAATATVTATVPFTGACGVEKKRYNTIEARQAPIEVQTVVYTTVTVIDNSIQTLTGTAILNVLTQSFPRTVAAYQTVTETGTVTITEIVCPT
ncbi:hypothetical protein QBC38DRAFT_487648 [Podospora fimiseda]|uniref:Uncharacterized protein n=1 Tax=Podospora fimiseda TaxID=252190 RepID=A0AAN7BHR1_9PEZI|nr:hypothetical protein QBC38DRAFT_487648 [Podospora fimiseda]